MRNTSISETALIRRAAGVIRSLLPPGWQLGDPVGQSSRSGIDATIDVAAPDQRSSTILVEGKTRLEPSQVGAVMEVARRGAGGGAFLVVAPYLSKRTQERLTEEGASYADLTGNLRLVVAEPGLYVREHGASEDPNREERPGRSLRGAKAGRIARLLVERQRPPGVRELAEAVGVNAGYASRVLAFLASEALITREERGLVTRVDWPALLRRWSEDAPLLSRGHASTYLDPRGLATFLRRLPDADDRAVLTGGLGAAAIAPVAPPRLAMVWVHDASLVAERLGLRSTVAGANVMLLEAGDELPFEGAMLRDGLRYAAPAQTAADLLTSAGRGPAEGEELIAWMLANEEVWRR